MGLRKVLVIGAVGAVAYVSTQHGGTVLTSTPSGPVTANANERLANQMAASGYGWTGPQLTCLDELWTEESGFSAYAANPTSDARGIPQKISGWGGDYQPGAAAAQVRWGLIYIHDRYGSPCAAWRHEKSESPNWY